MYILHTKKHKQRKGFSYVIIPVGEAFQSRLKQKDVIINDHRKV